MRSEIKMLKHLFFLLLFCVAGISHGQTTLFNETFGVAGTLPGVWTSNSVSGWIGNNPTSCASYHGLSSNGYAGASGGSNALLYNGASGTTYTLTYSGVSTVGYTNIIITWGGRYNTNYGNNAVSCQYNNNVGSGWVTIQQDLNANDPGCSTWYLLTAPALPASCNGVANLQIRFSVLGDGGDVYYLDDVTIKGTSAGATSSLSSANPSVPTANITQSSTKNQIYDFSTAIVGGNMTINTVNFTTAGGTYVAADVTQFQLWYATSNSIAAASQIGSNITTTLGNGAHSFTGLSQVINSGTTGYFFIVADIPAGATVGHTIIVSAITPANLTFASGSSAGTAYAGGTQTITAPACTSTLPFTENFDALWTTPTTLITQTCAWSGATGGGANSNDQWQRDDDGAGWTGGTTGSYAPAYTSASHSARFHTYEAPNGSYGDLITPQIDFTPVGTKTITFQYINPEGTTLDVSLSTDGGVTYASVGTISATLNSWTSESFSLGASTSSKCKIRFRSTSDFGNYDMGIDDVGITVPASGAPSTQSKTLVFANADCNSFDISWTSGNGSSRYVSMNTSNTFAVPSNGTAPAAANTVWANAGEQVVYVGSGNSVSVSGMAAGTTYWFKVFDYNGSGASIQYCVAVGAGNPASKATVAIVAAPTTSASGISFSSIACNQVTVSWTNGNGANRILVAKSSSAVAGTPVNASGYSANASFSSGSAIAAGEYVVYSGSGTSVTVTSLNASTTYYFKIFEDNGSTGCESYKTSVPPSGNVTTISCVNQIPYMVSAVINACNGSCNSEGSNELLFYTSGSYAIPVNTANMVLTYGSSAAPTKVFNGSITANPAQTANFNAQVGCTAFFIDAVTAGTIPANSLFFMVNNTYCDGAYDFTALCASGYGPLYVVYVNDPTWVSGTTAGNYANSGGSIRYFRTDFSAVTGGGSSGVTDYSYYPSSLVCDCDGASVTWTSSGGAPSQYVSPNSCSFAKSILPIELIDFSGNRSDDHVILNWSTASETNNNYFTLERSDAGGQFVAIGKVKGAGTSSQTLYYTFNDDGAPSSECYYRLKQTDFNGISAYSPVIFIRATGNFMVETVYPNPATDLLTVAVLHEKSVTVNLSVYDVLGKCVYVSSRSSAGANGAFNIDISKLAPGVYVLKVEGGAVRSSHTFIKQ
jgi:hypothetical protein